MKTDNVMKRSGIICIIFCAFFFNSFAKTYYVNSLATGLNNGFTWANAFTIVDSAWLKSSNGDTIKIAAGLYTGFNLKNGVTFLGGYPNSGNPTDTQRDWINQQTILSNSTGGAAVIGALNVDTASVLDGFLIEGKGILIQNSSSLIFRNIVLEKNSITTLQINKGQATFLNCAFDNNYSYTNVIDISDSSNTTFTNCIFSANSPGTSVGGFNYYIISNLNSVTAINNCDIVNNAGIGFNGTGSGSATIENTIFWNNKISNQEISDIFPGNQVLNVGNCITQTYYGNGVKSILVNDNPRFYNALNPAGPDNKFFTSDDGLQLTAPCSPAINFGINSYVSGIPTDILGASRIYNNGSVDLGPYEYQGNPGTPLAVVYVNSNASNTGINNGSSWQDAFKTLQQALLYCADTIKISAGTYPTDNSYVDSIFSIENKKVILGGYPATGNPTDAQRNPILYQTLLQGNYTGTYTGLVSHIIRSYHCDTTTIIDGLAFSNQATQSGGTIPSLYIAYESNLKVINCNFLYLDNSNLSGGGMQISQSSAPIIAHCKFNTNSSTYSGGAITCENSSPAISYCQFFGTNAGLGKTGFAINYTQSAGTVDSCIFGQSTSSNIGGTIQLNASNVSFKNCVFRSSVLSNLNNSNSTFNNCVIKSLNTSISNYSVINDNSNPVFSKCLFDSSTINVGNFDRAAPVFNNCVSINGMFMKNTKSFPVLNNCTVINTIVNATNGFTSQELIDNSDSSILHANNTIFWGNELSSGSKDINDFPAPADSPTHVSTSILYNCVTRNYGTNGVHSNLVGINPRFENVANLYGQDKVMFTQDDGIRLAVCSPAVNTGNNALGTILSTDVLNNPRIVNGTVDIGATELQQVTNFSRSFYVNANATGNNSGTSWQNAYTSFQTAVCNACADSIRISAGTYKAAVTNRDSTFLINHAITLLGGYPNTGTPTEALRNPIINPTILSGNIGNLNDSVDNSKNIITVTGVSDSVVIDGFIIRDGWSDGKIGLNATGGAGISLYYDTTIIRNCQFINNRAFPTGGAISIGSLASCKINNSIFIGNSSVNAGGAIEGGALQLTSCVFDHNHGGGNGGAIQVGSSFNASNSIFYGNYITAKFGNGGAIDAALCFGKIYNCTFLNNTTSSSSNNNQGGAIYTNSNLGLIIKNCIFNGNTVNGSTQSFGSDVDSRYSTVFNCLLQVGPVNLGSNNLLPASPGFLNIKLPKGNDGVWMTSDDGLQLNYNSPAIDMGDNSAVASLAVDILGNNRIINNIVDAGPYEYQKSVNADAGPDSTICYGDSIVIGKKADSSFTYSWTSIPAGFISSQITPLVKPLTPTTYILSVTDGVTIAKDSVTVTPIISVSPSINISSDTTIVCKGTASTFYAFSNYGGDSVKYQWQVNGVNAGTDSNALSIILGSDSNKIIAIMTSSVACANPKTDTSNVVIVKVNPMVHSSVSISVPDTSICQNDSLTFTAQAVNEGTNTGFVWIVGSTKYTTNSNIFTTPALVSSTNVEAIMTTTAACNSTATDSSNIIAINVAGLSTPSVSITANNITVCKGDSITFIANPMNGGTAPSYVWEVNGTISGGNTNSFGSNNLNNGDKIQAVLKSNFTCLTQSVANSNILEAIIKPLIVDSIIISGNSVVNSGQSSIIISSTINSGNNPIYQWQDSTGANSGWTNISGAQDSSISYTPAKTGDKIRCVLNSSESCASPTTAFSYPIIFTINNDSTSTSPSNNRIRFYPNPFFTTITVDSLKITDNWETLDILSINGNKIESFPVTNKQSLTVNLNQLSSGIYIACLRRKQGFQIYVKIIKLP